MSNPTRSETLKALKGAANYKFRYEDIAMIVLAAQAWAQIAPDTCPLCDGKKSVLIYEPFKGKTPCTFCDARGWVWDNDLVTRMAQAYAEAEGFISPADDALVAMRAALDVLLGGDTDE